jgi:hypothetical protein
LPDVFCSNNRFLTQCQAFTGYGNLRICVIFERGAGDHNFAPVAEQKRAKNSRFSASILRSRAKTARGDPIYNVK